MLDALALLMSEPSAFEGAGTALDDAAAGVDGASSRFRQAVGTAGRSWRGPAAAAHGSVADSLAGDLDQAASALRRAATAAADGATALQAVVTELRTTVEEAYDAGFLVLLPEGVVQPGPELQAAAAATGPGAPAAEAAYEAAAAALTSAIAALVAEANSIDAEVAAEIAAALEGAGAADPAPGADRIRAMSWTTRQLALGDQLAWTEMSPKARSLFKELDKAGGMIPVRPGEVSTRNLADLTGFTLTEYAVIQDRVGRLYLVRGGQQITRIPAGMYYLVHTHPEPSMPGVPSPGNPNSHSMVQDLANKRMGTTTHPEAVVSMNDDVRWFDHTGFLAPPAYGVPSPINHLGFIVPFHGLGEF